MSQRLWLRIGLWGTQEVAITGSWQGLRATSLALAAPLKLSCSIDNAASPGPAILADEGDELVVDFMNNLQQPTTTYWHGIRNVNEMDGVPGLTQIPIEPDETFIYRFPVNYGGTY